MTHDRVPCSTSEKSSDPINAVAAAAASRSSPISVEMSVPSNTIIHKLFNRQVRRRRGRSNGIFDGIAIVRGGVEGVDAYPPHAITVEGSRVWRNGGGLLPRARYYYSCRNFGIISPSLFEAPRGWGGRRCSWPWATAPLSHRLSRSLGEP